MAKKIKEIKTFDYQDDYVNNIQIQFMDDAKFNAFINMLSTYANEYQETLVEYGKLFNLNNVDTYPYILNSIGYILGLPPMGYFGDISTEQYKILIRGQQIKNSYNGTNASLLQILNTLLPQYGWIVEDTGDMALTIYLNPLASPYPSTSITQTDTSAQITINNEIFFSQPGISSTNEKTYRFSYLSNVNRWDMMYVNADGTAMVSMDINLDDYGITYVGTPANFSVDVVLLAIDPFIEQVFKEGWLTPKPAGVSLEYEILNETYFAWNETSSTTTPQTSGWNEGVWL